MTQDILTDLGEEYLIKNGLDGASIDVGLYNDSTDDITDSDDLGDLTTEPSNSNYSRQSSAFAAADISGDWGADNDDQCQFDFSDQSSSETVDTAFLMVNFQADDTSDGSATDHIVATVALTQDRDIGSIDTLTFASGDIDVTLD